MVAFAAVLLLGGGLTAAEWELQGEKNGLIRQGPYLLFSSDPGGLVLLLNNQALAEGIGIECGVDGYTTFKDFQNKKQTRGNGSITLAGQIRGQEVIFTQKVSIEGRRIKIEVRRKGKWAKSPGWCSLVVRLPAWRYELLEYRVDGELRELPTTPRQKTVATRVRAFEPQPGKPELNIKIESPQNLTITDFRESWRRYTFGISAPIGRGGDEAVTRMYLTMPQVPEAVMKPALRRSLIGYPVEGDKFVVLEWLRFTERPDDRVKLVTADGTVVKGGRFGQTVEFMLNNFAEFDFSEIKTPGDYFVVWYGGKTGPIRIREHVFEDRLWQPTLDVFIPWQMCHAEVRLGSKAPVDVLPRCHMDDGIRAPANFNGPDGFRSFACEGVTHDAGGSIPCAKGGWHDAGDHDINLPAQAYVVWVLSLAYEEFSIDRDIATLDVAKQAFTSGKPDGIPDILQQVEWGAYWMLTMQQDNGHMYLGACGQPGRYTASVIPAEATDGKPGTGDERHIYVDYHPGHQLQAAVSLAAAGRVLRVARPRLAERCVAAARKAFGLFKARREVYDGGSYFRYHKRNKGRDGMVAVVATELYMTTQDASYLQDVAGVIDGIRSLQFEWPSPRDSRNQSFWYCPPSLARLYPHLERGPLKTAVLETCRRAAKDRADKMHKHVWPFWRWSFHSWGNCTECVARPFDAYWLSKVAPDIISVRDAIPSMLWLYGLHPLCDTAFVCGMECPGPRFLYSGRLHGRFERTQPADVPGAMVPGMGGFYGGIAMTYVDARDYYRYNEACIYGQETYIFAVNALKQSGY